MEPQQHPPAASPAPKRPVKFVGSDEDGLPLKRRQVQQACDPCRKKKKRCPHGAASHGFSFVNDHGPVQRPAWSPTSQPQPSQPQPQPQQQLSSSKSSGGPSRLPLSPDSSEKNDESSSAALVASQLVELSASRFVGDLSPESVLIEATNRESADKRLQRNRSEVGGWMRDAGRPNVEAAEESDAASRGRGMGDASNTEQLHAGPVTFGGRLERPGRDAIKSCLTVYPPEKEYQHLCNIYLDSIHPILPIIKHVDVLSTLSSTRLSPRQVVFKQGITLAATLEPSASGYLRLEAKGPLLSPQDFHQKLSRAIFASLDANVLTDRVDHIRILLLMFFYYQPRHASERDFSPLIFSQAVHYSQSLGLHLCEYGKDSGNADAECLFCILWVLDRINASFHGRPCLLHHRDTDRELDECIAKQEQPAFRLLMRVAKMLDRVICLYRPRNDGVEKVEMPIFESMIIETGAEKLPSRLLSTVEIFYHAVSILSCRESSASIATPTQETAEGHLPHPNINARRSLSADRIVDAVAASLAQPASPDGICVMPFVAYAVALSLSVAYQKMRYSRISMYRLRARNRFEEIVTLLQRVGSIYTSARVNAALGVAILREMDKTAKQLVTSNNAGTPGPKVEASTAARPLSTPHEDTPERQVVIRDGPSEVGQGKAPQQQSAGAGVQRLVSPVVTEGGSLTPFASRGDNTPSSDAAMELDRMSQHAAAIGNVPPAWGDLSDIDLFVHFDPGFDLSAVDTALEANLDMGYPQTWTMQWPE
ncbi:hypothetical protein N0V82_009552 [Gnomoniopsis sp. IMI 355080]|nr:hypothetical protein N0V82_009552 [Gnomoniopsis sp. IMI 355080]